MANRSSFNSYQFPIDLPSEEHPNYIVFKAQKVDFGGARKVSGSQSVNTADAQSPVSSKSGKVPSLAPSPDKLTSVASISMFFPLGVSSDLSVNYAQHQFGATGAAILDNQLTGSKEDALNGLGNVAGAAIQDLIRDSQKPAAVLQRATGKVINPFSYQVFQGVNHRQFQYTFPMIPKSQDEANQIRDIQRSFYKYSLPERTDSEVQFISIPYQWDIKYYRQGKELGYLIPPGSSYLQTISLDYTGDTNHFHTDGSPLQTKMTLTFAEIEPLYRDKVANPGDDSNQRNSKSRIKFPFNLGGFNI